LDYLKQLNTLDGSSTGGSLFVMTDDAAFYKARQCLHQIKSFGLAGTTAPDLARADGLQDLDHFDGLVGAGQPVRCRGGQFGKRRYVHT
jgi:hypothetical protein